MLYLTLGLGGGALFACLGLSASITHRASGLVNLAIGTIHPPVGVSLVITSAIARVQFEKTIMEGLPFLAVLVAMLMAMIFVPEVVLWLPRLVFGS